MIKTTGPIAATINSMKDIGWHPVSPAVWVQPDTGKLIRLLDENGHKTQIKTELREHIVKQLWTEEATRDDAKGTEKGEPDLQIARGIRAEFTSKGNTAAAKAIDGMIMGTFSDPKPDDQGFFANEHLCILCDRKAVADAWHITYGCPRHENSTDKFIDNTNKYRLRAKKAWNNRSCLFQKGIIPADWIGDATLGKNGVTTWAAANFKHQLDKGGFAYTDGSGGGENAYKQTKRV